MHKARADGRNAPEDHDSGEEDGGSQALEQDVGQRLEEGVGDKEDAETHIVLPVLHVKAIDQPTNFGIADVGAVNEADQVEEGSQGISCKSR
jgi:hypothetical protein